MSEPKSPVSLELLMKRVRENPDGVASAYILIYGIIVELEDARVKESPGQFQDTRVQALIHELKRHITALSLAIIENTEQSPPMADRSAITKDERRPLPGEPPFQGIKKSATTPRPTRPPKSRG